MIRSLVALLLSSGLAFAYIARIYHVTSDRDYATIGMNISTSWCGQPRMRGNVTPSVGFIDENGRLLWKFTLSGINRWKDDSLQKNSAYNLKAKIPIETVSQIEEACDLYANGTFDRYENCFRPNIVNIEKSAWRRSSLWKPTQISTRIDFVAHARTADMTTFEKSLTIGPFYDCSSNWVDGALRNTYIRWDTKDFSGHADLPSLLLLLGIGSSVSEKLNFEKLEECDVSMFADSHFVVPDMKSATIKLIDGKQESLKALNDLIDDRPEDSGQNLQDLRIFYTRNYTHLLTILVNPKNNITKHSIQVVGLVLDHLNVGRSNTILLRTNRWHALYCDPDSLYYSVNGQFIGYNMNGKINVTLDDSSVTKESERVTDFFDERVHIDNKPYYVDKNADGFFNQLESGNFKLQVRLNSADSKYYYVLSRLDSKNLMEEISQCYFRAVPSRNVDDRTETPRILLVPKSNPEQGVKLLWSAPTTTTPEPSTSTPTETSTTSPATSTASTTTTSSTTTTTTTADPSTLTTINSTTPKKTTRAQRLPATIDVTALEEHSEDREGFNRKPSDDGLTSISKSAMNLFVNNLVLAVVAIAFM
ncbi:hypothetical protein QR680_014333 [Steinernema hermaphroditum]|uniref:DOMON domain-containing protein n=1 Tax=Steinernema hermaphroditum TaxID=289476 RepID=A0AA39M3W8_9BILA|nr:hypothetical protein QR680_014333 [Steinernema hermaphroditum]